MECSKTITGLTRAVDIFGGKEADLQANSAKLWLESKGIANLPTLPLTADELDKVCHSDLRLVP